jgi:polysaccharide chain length determinant protein (PEP-CTERM system associated)
MPLRSNMKPSEFLDILRRRKWVTVFSFLLIFLGATVYSVLAPDLYQSSMKLLLIPPTVSEGAIRSNVNLGSRERLTILQQEILSRSRLLGVINDLGLFRGSGDDDEERVNKTRRRLTMSKNDLEANNTFSLSFYHEDPKVAMSVASRLGSLFIEGNIKSREATGKETSTFLESRAQETRRRLEQQEDKIKRYKLQFGGELPQQEQSNLNRLQRLQDQIKNNSESIARLQDRKVFMEAQISNMERNIRAAETINPFDSAGSATQASPGSLLSELAMRRKKLEELSEKYTPLYPAVVQARWEVKQLEEKIANQRRSAKNTKGVSTPDPQTTNWEGAESQRLREQVAAIDLEIVALKRESVNTVRTIDQIQQKVERLPQREQEMISLSRDYDNIKRSYEELMAKKMDSQISQKLEEKQKGEQFKILEPADLPTRASKPNRLKVLGLALLASLVIGAGGPFALEMLDPTLRGTGEFKSYFDMPILGVLPVIQNDQLQRRIAVRRAAVIGGLVSILGAYLVFLVVNGQKVQSILQSFGLSIGGGN